MESPMINKRASVTAIFWVGWHLGRWMSEDLEEKWVSYFVSINHFRLFIYLAESSRNRIKLYSLSRCFLSIEFLDVDLVRDENLVTAIFWVGRHLGRWMYEDLEEKWVSYFVSINHFLFIYLSCREFKESNKVVFLVAMFPVYRIWRRSCSRWESSTSFVRNF